MTFDYPPPNPADRIPDGFLARHVSDSPDEPWMAPERREERSTAWADLIVYRDAYRGRHATVER